MPKRFRIVPKRDFGNSPGYWLPGVPGGVGTGSYGFVKSGWIVTDGVCNVMPGAAWFRSIKEACQAIRHLNASNGDANLFWRLLRADQEPR